MPVKPSSSLSLICRSAARKTAVASQEPAFYTGVVGAAVTEQLYKEKHWEDHPGEAVPLMKPKFYGGPWKVLKGDVLPPNE
ncbi:hypothetical protein V6N11_055655 [Hibiscus sabdariffa]|uniref:Uncharacterized protein n=2 Tax=Hibiscus sabdariffa TaxID=183260 RepID=A0ABR2AC17_9ROSI